MAKRRILILIVILLALIGIAVFVFLFLNNKVRSLAAFPEEETEKTDFSDNNWSFSPIQGVVKSYAQTPEGINYINLEYYPAGKKALVKVLLNIPKDNTTIYSSAAEIAALEEKTHSRRNYIDLIGVVISPNDPQKRLMAVDEFKRVYKPGAILKILAVKEYPDKALRDDDFCRQRGYFLCVVADLADLYGGDFPGFLIPYYFSSVVNLND